MQQTLTQIRNKINKLNTFGIIFLKRVIILDRNKTVEQENILIEGGRSSQNKSDTQTRHEETGRKGGSPGCRLGFPGQQYISSWSVPDFPGECDRLALAIQAVGGGTRRDSTTVSLFRGLQHQGIERAGQPKGWVAWK